MRMAPDLALALALIAPFTALADADDREITFTKVLDSDTAVPGEDGSVGPLDLDERLPGRRRLYADPHIAMDDEGNLAFSARGPFAILDGQVHRVVQPPGDLRHLSIDRGRVTFGVLGATGGIFRWERGAALVEVVGARTSVPDGGGCVFWTKEDGISSYPFSVDGDAILFSGTSNERAYSDVQTFDCDDLDGNFLWWNGSIERLGLSANPLNASIDARLIAFGGIQFRELGEASTSLVGPGDPIPGRSATFHAVWEPAVAAGRVAFRGRDNTGRDGVYLWENGVLSVIAEEGMPLPGGRSLERLDMFNAFRLGDDRAAVFGTDGEGPFLYLASLEDGWERVIALPDIGIGSGESMGEFDRGQLVLVGEGVYVICADGFLLKVLESGDVVEGRRVRSVYAGDLRKNRLALGITFDGSPTDNLYVAELPSIRVAIDVRPWHVSNRIHARSRRSIRVAILGSETFDVEDVDVATVGLGPDAAPARGTGKLRDTNHDGWSDLVLRFRPRETGIVAGETEVCLSGEIFGGIEFEGCDGVRASQVETRLSR